MSLILNKNAVLTGPVDSLCLACEDHLQGDEDAVLHVAKPIHKKNLEATGFFDKYEADRVRKVKKGYYCEYCNVFLKTSAKVGPHVTEARHCERKASKPLKRQGNSVIAFEKVFISEKAWHGLTDDTCSVCDAQFDNALLHKTETAHILNLVLAEVEIADGNVYRKVDDATFQCLTCNVVWAINDITAHFDGADHKKQYQECCDSAEKLINEHKKETPESAKEDNRNKQPEKEAPKDEAPKKESPVAVKEDNQGKKSKKVVPKDETSKNTSEKAIPQEDETKKTQEVVNVKINECSAEKTSTSLVTSPVHINENADKPKQEKEQESKQDKDKEPSQDSEVEAENYAKENNLVYSKVKNNAFCPICGTKVPPTLKNMKEHIKGVNHKNKVAQSRVKPAKSVVTKTTSHQFVDNAVTAYTPKQEKEEESKQDKDKEPSQGSKLEAENYAKENNLVYSKERNTAFCPICGTKVPPALKYMKKHIHGASHKNKAGQSKVKPVKGVVTKVPSHKFIDSGVSIETIFYKDMVINEKYCLNDLSFFMITKIGSKLRCQGCEMNLTRSQIEAHINTSRHERIMNESPVVSSEDSEFIRECRPNVFHCGFCNQLESPWSSMESHLKSTAHHGVKIEAYLRLQNHLPDVKQHRAREAVMQFVMLNRMLGGRMFEDY